MRFWSIRSMEPEGGPPFEIESDGCTSWREKVPVTLNTPNRPSKSECPGRFVRSSADEQGRVTCGTPCAARAQLRRSEHMVLQGVVRAALVSTGRTLPAEPPEYLREWSALNPRPTV
jgi:hypothetical protein